MLGTRRTPKYMVSEYEPNRMIALKAFLGPLQGQVRFAFEPVSEGTRFTQSFEMESSGWWNLITPFLVRMFTRDGEADLANIKRILENGWRGAELFPRLSLSRARASVACAPNSNPNHTGT
jgi:hypothetical protein